MPIRERGRRVTIECSDEQLPRAIAAFTGCYKPDIHITHVHSSDQRLYLSHHEENRSLNIRQIEYDDA